MTSGKTLGFTLLALFTLPAIGWAQDIACVPTTPIALQTRSAIKHRDPADASTTAQTTTVTKMLAWGAPAGIADSKTRRSNQPLDDHETQVYALEGDLWRVIVEE